jgi:hypothetical protein
MLHILRISFSLSIEKKRLKTPRATSARVFTVFANAYYGKTPLCSPGEADIGVKGIKKTFLTKRSIKNGELPTATHRS